MKYLSLFILLLISLNIYAQNNLEGEWVQYFSRYNVEVFNFKSNNKLIVQKFIEQNLEKTHNLTYKENNSFIYMYDRNILIDSLEIEWQNPNVIKVKNKYGGQYLMVKSDLSFKEEILLDSFFNIDRFELVISKNDSIFIDGLYFNNFDNNDVEFFIKDETIRYGNIEYRFEKYNNTILFELDHIKGISLHDSRNAYNYIVLNEINNEEIKGYSTLDGNIYTIKKNIDVNIKKVNNEFKSLLIGSWIFYDDFEAFKKEIKKDKSIKRIYIGYPSLNINEDLEFELKFKDPRYPEVIIGKIYVYVINEKIRLLGMKRENGSYDWELLSLHEINENYMIHSRSINLDNDDFISIDGSAFYLKRK